MTSEQATALIEIGQRCTFLLHVCALGIAVCWGAAVWRLIVLAKNQRHFW